MKKHLVYKKFNFKFLKSNKLSNLYLIKWIKFQKYGLGFKI